MRWFMVYGRAYPTRRDYVVGDYRYMTCEIPAENAAEAERIVKGLVYEFVAVIIDEQKRPNLREQD